jgi:hypothetical protein
MATLEMRKLRSKYPNTGRMTLRYEVPPFDVPPADLDDALREVLNQNTTTPQVAESDSTEGETPAGKGGQAR